MTSAPHAAIISIGHQKRVKVFIRTFVLFYFIFCGFSEAYASPDIKLFHEAAALQKKNIKHVQQKDKIVIIDYHRSIFEKRLWVIDLKKRRILMHTEVGHAGLSGIFYASDFSNTPDSYMSSIGSFVTTNTYKGHFGYSLNVEGLDKGVNDNAFDRRIVFHKMRGQPWSHGCFTIPRRQSRKLINLIKDGVFMYVRG